MIKNPTQSKHGMNVEFFKFLLFLLLIVSNKQDETENLF